MRDGVCPKCGSSEVYMREKNGGSQMNTIPLGGSWSIRQFPLDNYVCTSCGHVENYISDEKALKLIEEQWQYVKPGKRKHEVER